MGCYLITQGGWGDVWKFWTPQEAGAHVLYGGGDPVLSYPSDIPANYRVSEIPILAGVVGGESLARRVRAAIPETGTERRRAAAMEAEIKEVWDALVAVAKEPPADAARIARKDRKMAEAKAAAAGAAAKKNETAGGASPIGARKYADTAKITFNKDKDGKPYGPDNNPKKIGSATHGFFSKYRSGMTVGEYAKAIEDAKLGDGAKARRRVGKDVRKGFITVA